jgi:hypothetical protein
MGVHQKGDAREGRHYHPEGLQDLADHRRTRVDRQAGEVPARMGKALNEPEFNRSGTQKHDRNRGRRLHGRQ